MALATCRECSREVSTEADSCPHCGVPDPARAPTPDRQSQGKTSAGTVAAGTFAGILGCVIAPAVLGFGLLFLLLMIGTCA